MPANTSAASAICGTHFGLTNADTSITGRCAALSRLTNSILSAVETERVLVLQAVARPDFDDGDAARRSSASTPPSVGVGLHELAFAAADRRDDAVAERADRQLHLHRFEHDERVAFLHGVAGRDAAP